MDYNIVSIHKTDYDYLKPDTNKKPELNEICLYVRFSIPVNSASINNDSAFITDEISNVLRSTVSYDSANNMLIVSTSEQVYENEIYYLNLSNNIKSVTGKSLKNDVRFKFVIKGGKPGEFMALKGKQVISPTLGGTRKATIADVSIIDKIDVNSLPFKHDKKLPVIRNFDSVLTVIVFIFALTMTYITGYEEGYVLAAVLGMLFILLVLMNNFTDRGRAINEYNKGVRLYNENKFENAVAYFEKSLVYDGTNRQYRIALEIALAKSRPAG